MFSIVTWAEQNASVEEKTWADDYHQFFTKKIHLFSHHLDKKLSSYEYLFETNATTIAKKNHTSEKASEPAVNDWFSSFFKDEIFDEVYTKSYVIVRGTAEYDHRTGDISFSGKMKASLALPKTEDRLHFFIEDSDDLDSRDFGRETRNNVGLRYFQKNERLIKSSFSLGLHSYDDPYARTTFWLPYQIGAWRNRISQRFQYSVDEKFEEETRLYFDRILDDDAFVRFLAARWTKEEVDGMEYFGNIVYNKTTKFNQGYQLGVSSLGHTEPENEIIQYAAYGVYKENIHRKWLFYEIEPRVEWDRAFDFEPNYKLLVSLEVFFGDL
jgi:hypothetical protein